MCGECEFLNDKKDHKGAVGGKAYYCSKRGCYIRASNKKCNQFEKNKKRSKDKIKSIKEDGDKYNDMPMTADTAFIIFIIMAIIFIIMLFTGALD